jgi:ubiquinone/menaquinone biosynthesis C-methylase UbiE
MRFLRKSQSKRKKIRETNQPEQDQALEERSPRTISVRGRRYYRDAPYALPKDMADIHRLDFQHYALRQALKGNYTAPIHVGKDTKILDVGCGTGRWGIEMALDFPTTQVVGVDLEESGLHVTRPLNYRFQQANVLENFPFGNNMFDYIHQRLLVMGIPVTKWVDEIGELLRVAKVDGYVELIEAGNTFSPVGPYTRRWQEWAMDFSQSIGLDPSAVPLLEQFARQAGMRITQSTCVEVPITTWNGKLGGWRGRVGSMMLTNMKAVYEALKPRYLHQLGLDPEVVALMPTLLEEEWNRLETHLKIYIVVGQK